MNGWLIIIEDEEHAYFLKTTAERNKGFDKRTRKTRGLDKVCELLRVICLYSVFYCLCFRSSVELSRGLQSL